MTTPHQDIIDSYFDCWNQTDADARRAAVERAWTHDATNADPLNQVTGHDELDAMFASTQAAYPGNTFRQVGVADRHHDLVRWGWEMVDPEGTVVLDGIDVALLADDGRLSYLAGFFGAAIPTAVA